MQAINDSPVRQADWRRFARRLNTIFLIERASGIKNSHRDLFIHAELLPSQHQRHLLLISFFLSHVFYLFFHLRTLPHRLMFQRTWLLVASQVPRLLNSSLLFYILNSTERWIHFFSGHRLEMESAGGWGGASEKRGLVARPAAESVTLSAYHHHHHRPSFSRRCATLRKFVRYSKSQHLLHYLIDPVSFSGRNTWR